MSAERLSMRKVREVLRLQSAGLSPRQIARSLLVGRTTVVDYQRRAKLAGITWPLPETLDDEALERALFVPREDHRSSRPLPDWTEVHKELRRKHVTLALLWEEYKTQHPDGYHYSQFCDLHRRWASRLEIWMRQEHKAGEKIFSDYSGDGIPWTNPKTAEIREAPLFVAVLGASNYTYAEVTESQELRYWIRAHVHTFAFYDGVSKVVVPDQTRTAVKTTCRYEPEINPSFQELARHYSTCIVPARPRKPRDKAKVEVGVLIAQRWIIARLRDHTFYSPEEINEAIWNDLLPRLNNRPMRKLKRSRAELFLAIDKPALQPLPQLPYELATWKVGLRVNVDYHVELERNYYSVPSQLAHEQVDVRATTSTIEIFHAHRRVASHLRQHGEYQHSTVSEHMPTSHRAHAEWTPSRILRWAEEVGPDARALAEKILSERQHPEQGYRACLGIMRLGKRYGRERLEMACKRALAFRAHSYRFVESVLKKNLDGQPLPEFTREALPPHENVRGASYYT